MSRNDNSFCTKIFGKHLVFNDFNSSMTSILTPNHHFKAIA